MWKDLFAFTKAERRGIIVLSILLLLIILFRIFRDDIFPPKPIHISVEYIDASPKKTIRYQPLKLIKFDPNSVDSLTLVKMHLPKRIIKNIINYREAGGKYRKPEDLQKLYAIDSAWMDSLRDYISIKLPETTYHKKEKVEVKKQHIQLKKSYPTTYHKTTKKVDEKRPLIELNAADTTQLKSIYGIGSVYANRIVKFRDWLGGFYSVEQIKEVYGMKEEWYQKIAPYLSVDTTLITKIAINKQWQYSLQKHPYCSKQQAKAIIHYRKEQGKIADYNTLKTIEVKAQTWKKLRPYVEY